MAGDRIDAVLFDLGNTLVSYYRSADFHPILERSVSTIVHALRARGRDVDAVDAFERALRYNRERSDLRVWPLHERLCEIFSPPGPVIESEMLDVMTEHFLAPIFAVAKADPEALPVLRSIKASGLKCAIVSNTPWGSPAEPWRRELLRWGLLDAVDEAVFCVDAGWRKPAPEIFSFALAKLGVDANRAVFVGDDIRWDIEGARGSGLMPVLLTETAETQPSCHSIQRLSQLLPLLREIA